MKESLVLRNLIKEQGLKKKSVAKWMRLDPRRLSEILDGQPKIIESNMEKIRKIIVRLQGEQP